VTVVIAYAIDRSRDDLLGLLDHQIVGPGPAVCFIRGAAWRSCKYLSRDPIASETPGSASRQSRPWTDGISVTTPPALSSRSAAGPARRHLVIDARSRCWGSIDAFAITTVTRGRLCADFVVG